MFLHSLGMPGTPETSSVRCSGGPKLGPSQAILGCLLQLPKNPMGRSQLSQVAQRACPWTNRKTDKNCIPTKTIFIFQIWRCVAFRTHLRKSRKSEIFFENHEIFDISSLSVTFCQEFFIKSLRVFSYDLGFRASQRKTARGTDTGSASWRFKNVVQFLEHFAGFRMQIQKSAKPQLADRESDRNTVI